MEELLKELGISEADAARIIERYNAGLEAVRSENADAVSAIEAERDTLKQALEESGSKYSELEAKYNEASAAAKSAGYREFLFGEGIDSPFVRSALAKELEAQGFDLADKAGAKDARSYIDGVKKDNPTLFGAAGKPFVSVPSGTEPGGGQADGVKAAFAKLNPKANIN